MQNTGKKTISRSFLTGLLIIVLIGFIASIGFSWMLQTRLSNENAAELLRINIKDVKQDILDASDKNLLELAHEVADSLDNGLNTSPERLAELMKQYDVSEIDLVNADGIIVGCTNPEFVGFDMKSGEQSAEFMALADGTAKEVVQNYQPISYDASISRKYGGVAIEGGFLQVGYDAARFQKDVDRAMVGLTHNWHVGRGGFVLISDRDRTIVSDPFRNEGKNLEITGLRIDTETMPEDQIFRQTVYDIPCSCLYGFSEGYLGADDHDFHRAVRDDLPAGPETGGPQYQPGQRLPFPHNGGQPGRSGGRAQQYGVFLPVGRHQRDGGHAEAVYRGGGLPD